MKGKANWKFWVLLALSLAWTGFIFARSMRNAEQSAQESAGALSLLKTLFPWLTDHMVRKAAHFTEFFLLGGLAAFTCLAAKRRRLWIVPLWGAAAAVTDECIQYFVPGRSCQVTDMLLDLSGVLIALGLILLIRALRKSKKPT